MPIYTAEANGTPFVALEAADEATAREVLERRQMQHDLSTRYDTAGKRVWGGVSLLVIRLATEPEREKFRAEGAPGHRSA
jgi:hypothetical protein